MMKVVIRSGENADRTDVGKRVAMPATSGKATYRSTTVRSKNNKA
jgi:hypothetical protein